MASPFIIDDSTIRRKMRRASASPKVLIRRRASKDVAFCRKIKLLNFENPKNKLKCSYQALELKDFDTRIAGTTGKGFNSQLGLTVELPGDAGRAGVGGKVDGDVTWLAEHEIVESHLTFGLRRNCKMV
jgi:hypothetical protein